MKKHQTLTVRNSPPHSWEKTKDSSLLKLRLCDLGLVFSENKLRKRGERLNLELKGKGLKFEPFLYFGDEWFSPEGMNAISIPFYLGHPKLVALEKKRMPQIEGAHFSSFMKLLRHEAGHCFDHCYGFSKRAKWVRIFGSPTAEYLPETYNPFPWSRRFVTHLDHHYAQAHPDEDFAETFAVWLDPSRNWRQEYRRWPFALRKLQYVDELAKESESLKIQVEKGRLPFASASLKITLENYYKKKKGIE